MRPVPSFLLAMLAAPAFVFTALRCGPDPVAAVAADALIHRRDHFTGSGTCASCHPDHLVSWQRTHHAQMTQRPTPDAVVGAFDGRVVRYEGQEARPFRDGGVFAMDLPVAGRDGPGRRRAEVALAVGSRRYQQYFEARRDGDAVTYVRLPLLWHIEQQRWLHVNTVFLGPDDGDWVSHAAVWNENCIFCHNTAPQPGLRGGTKVAREQARFDSEVAELGIACEACHGPGGAHAERHAEPLARWFRGHAAAADGVVDPAKLDQARSVSVCGQCHGARLPNPFERVDQWFTTGPTYRPGDALLDHVALIRRDTPVRGGADPELFALRFWRDGTPRLSAYELQGVTTSACFTHGAMTCVSCHAMHRGDPKGQLRPELTVDGLCTQCHPKVAANVAAHTHHAVDGSGSSCVECHMPRIVYGVLETHRSHRIEIPDAARDAAAGRPHACTLCHTDKSLPWAAQAMQRLWGGERAVPTARADRAPIDLPDAIASLHAGDAAVRAIYAAALGRPTAAPAAADTALQRAHLAIAMGDGYPSVRWLAQRSLQQLEARLPIGIGERLAGIDSLAGPEARAAAVFGTLDDLARLGPRTLHPPPPGALLSPALRLDVAGVARLTDLQGNNLISIGE